MGLDYVDIFYHHRMDPETPLWETMDALAGIVRSGKALYVGLSNYSPEKLKEASELLNEMGVPCLIHQHRYSMLDRANEKNRGNFKRCMVTYFIHSYICAKIKNTVF